MMQLFGFILVLLSYSVFAHEDAFIITKNFNTKNVLHYEAIVKDCKLVHPYVSVYWIVGENNGEEAKLNFTQRSLAPKVLDDANEYEAEFTLKALKGVRIEGAKNSFIMRMVDCKPKAYVVIDGQEVELSEIHAEFTGMFNTDLQDVIIRGTRPDKSKFKLKINVN